MISLLPLSSFFLERPILNKKMCRLYRNHAKHLGYPKRHRHARLIIVDLWIVLTYLIYNNHMGRIDYP